MTAAEQPDWAEPGLTAQEMGRRYRRWKGEFVHVDEADREISVHLSRFHGPILTMRARSGSVYVGDAAVDLAPVPAPRDRPRGQRGAVVTAVEHTLVRDGWPLDDEGRLLGLRGVPGRGRAGCSCGWLSAPLPDTWARRAAHAQHVTEETP